MKLFLFDVEFLSIKDPDGDREHPICIYQAFLCSKPKHKFFKKVIEMVVEHVEVGYYGYDIFSPTGPSALGEAINLVTGKTTYSPHDVGFHDISGYKYILCLMILTIISVGLIKKNHFLNVQINYIIKKGIIFLCDL